MKTKIGFVNLLMASVLAFTAILGGIMPRETVQAYTTDSQVFINEIHYDNASTDVGEFIEIAGLAGTDLTGWSVVLYNGSNGSVYDTDPLIGSLPDSGNGFGFIIINYPTDGIQNGSPDGIALVNSSSEVVLFLSYEGSFTAVGGPADGLTSTDIGVAESSSTLVGQSLQLSGTGDSYLDFTWQAPASATPGAVNYDQTFLVGPLDPKINEFSASTTGTDVEYVEIYGTPNTDYSAYTLLEIEGDYASTGSPWGTIDEVITVGTTDANGFYLADLAANTFENGTITLLLVENSTGLLGIDLDTDDDGIFDVTPWDTIIDSVAVTDGGTGDITYADPVLGPNYDGISSFAPGGASRIPDGYDTESTTDWVRNDFDLAGISGYIGTLVEGEAYNTPGETNQIWAAPGVCDYPYTKIPTIQGSDMDSPYDGLFVATKGVVVGDFQDGKRGFFLQDPEGDDDPATSDGIFVYYTGLNVNEGEYIRVHGYVDEYDGLTEITGVSQAWYCGAGDPITPTELTLPVGDVNEFEAYESMLVTFPQDLYISEYFNFDRFGEIVLTSHRHLTPTAMFEPGSPEQVTMAEFYLLDRITLDDGRTASNPDPAIHPNGLEFTMDNLFRGGDLVTNVTGVMDYGYDLWRVQPTQGADYTSMNPRTDLPEDVGGDLKIASFNVLNYFSTLDNSGYICGPSEDMECRGADTAEEFTRQRDKIFAALSIIDADIVGLMEIENHVTDAAVMDLVNGLNAYLTPGTYDYVATGPIGTDAIKVAIIYKPASVTPIGDYAILDSTVDPRFLDDYNRPTLAQTFEEIATGETVTVAVNHLKSKGSDCEDVGDPDLGDGAGNCNLTRKTAAEAMMDWLAADPTGMGSMNTLIIGDLNSYDKEDPIDAVLAGADDEISTQDDFLDLIYSFVGEEAYGYVFDGQVGYLDHALANKWLFNQITGTTIWHINADEPDLIDYDTSFKKDAQDALYVADQYRSSDHDPVIIGMTLKTYQFYLPIINK